jgi:undecaprenyl-diphosphatase
MEQNEEVKKNIRRFTLFSAEFIIALFLAIALISLAFAIHVVFISNNHQFDKKVFDLVSQFVSPLRTNFLLFITFLGNHKFLLPINILLLVFFIVWKKHRLTIRITALLLTSVSLLFLMKLSIQRNRPDDPLLDAVSGFSFPSGHALMSVIFYGLLAYIAKAEIKIRWLRIIVVALLLFLILLISYSRIYLRVHYASDVLAGLSVGFIWLVLSLWLIKKIEKNRIRRKELLASKEFK